MHRMANLRVTKYRMATLVLAIGMGLQGCSRTQPGSPAAADGSTTTQGHLPFHSEIAPVSASENPDQVTPNPKLATTVPFRNPVGARVLPIGTLLTVQLDHSLSAASVHAGDAFAASVAAPLMLEGNTVIERGAEVTGRIEAAQSRHGSGYVELTLDSIRADGTLFPLQTSSLFARGSNQKVNVSSNAQNQVLGGIRIPKGRRLTFRLTAPVALGEPSSVEKHPAS
jgi:hypothetical protein